MTTLDRLTRIIVQNYKVDPTQLTMQQPLAALGIDSLGIIELMFLIEEEFGIKFPSDAEALPTIGDVVNCIDGLLGPQAVAPLPQQSA
jgi:acyl carrier protein